MNCMSRIICLREFFGMKDGQKLVEFSAEIKALSEPEKEYLATTAKAEMIRRGSHKPEDFGF
jgi:hypothetical protein